MDRYINIVESRKTESGFKRSSLVVFEDDVQKFTSFLERAMNKIRCREAIDDGNLVVGDGRRSYRICLPHRGKPALQLTEKREDATGTYRESIIVPVSSFDVFRKSLSKALDVINR